MGTSLFRRLFPRSQAAGLAATRERAETGDADAQFSVGLKCQEGGTEDVSAAGDWYRKAAEQGHPRAQYRLGLMYAHGQGMARDEALALGWIRKAAEGGEAEAQLDLGRRCHRASLHTLQMDTLECRLEAYKWLILASAQGYKGSAATCEQVTLKMSQEEVTEGNQRVASFVVRQRLNPACS